APVWVAFCLLLNPAFLQNATYAWTKLITVFFVLLALHVLFAENYTPRRAVVGFALFGLGVITLYSSCGGLLVFGPAWLFVNAASLRREPKVLLAVASACLSVVLPWVAFAVSRYGLALTFGSNSTVKDGSQFTLVGRALNAGYNLYTTIVPHPLRSF